MGNITKCQAHDEWRANYSLIEGKDYHKNIFSKGVEVTSLIVIMFLSAIANISVLTAIVGNHRLRTKPHSILILNLNVVDLLAPFGSMLFSAIDIFYEGYLLCYPSLCRIHGLFAIVSCIGNFSAVTLIAVHRCLTITRSGYNNRFGKKLVLMLSFGWLVIALMVIPPITGRNSKIVYTHGTHHCSLKMACGYYTVIIVLTYLVTIPVMVTSYGVIVLKLRKSSERVRKYHPDIRRTNETSASGPQTVSLGEDFSSSRVVMKNEGRESSPVDTPEEDMDACRESKKNLGEIRGASKARHLHHRNRHERQVALSGILLVMTTVVCWTPYFILHSCRMETAPSHALEIFTMWLVYLNAVLDPIIYTYLNQTIRAAVLRLWQKMFKMATCRTKCNSRE